MNRHCGAGRLVGVVREGVGHHGSWISPIVLGHAAVVDGDAVSGLRRLALLGRLGLGRRSGISGRYALCRRRIKPALLHGLVEGGAEGALHHEHKDEGDHRQHEAGDA